jgi:hypothetical protein
MKNIFLLYIPFGNYEAQVHYEDTIIKKVSSDRLFRFVDDNLKSKLKSMFGDKLITVWGSRDSSTNRSKFERMSLGDDILIVEGETVKLLGKIAAKTINPELSMELWKNLKGTSQEGWNLIYFIANPLQIELPFTAFNKLLGYSEDYKLRGFSSVSQDRLYDFYLKYDDLYSVLQRIKDGESIEQRKQEFIEPELPKEDCETWD